MCSNCHKGIHANILQLPKNWNFFDESFVQQLLNKKTKETHYCLDCGKIIAKTAVRCNDCAHKKNRVVDRPNRETLKQLIRDYPFTTIAKTYNVSDKTISKWCIFYNLPFRKKDIKAYSDQDWIKI